MHAGTPAAPALGDPTAGADSISVTCAAVDGATKYVVKVTRTGTTGVSPIEQTFTEETRAAAGGKLTVNLSGASDGLLGRGKWAVQVKASNEHAPPASNPSITHTATESDYSAPSADVVVGEPTPATITSLAGSSAGKASLTFTCVGVGWGEQPQAAEHAAGE